MPSPPIADTHRPAFLRTCRQTTALVSKRFAALACSPELLRQLNVRVRGLDGLASFLAFVSRHGGHVQQLKFSAVRKPAEATSATAAAATACLAAAGAAGQLTALEVHGIVPATHWLASMRALGSLCLHPFSGIGQPTTAALGMLTALQELQLFGSAASLEPGVQLPSSITWLHIARSEDEAMLQQVRRAG